ncbi:MAG: hypothetical protein JWP31_2334 [Aeromicrobium sp.]|nr:hypothetical protein [Aeromicrobium sp.]
MDPYVRELLESAPLAADDEMALARRARSGDAAARDALIRSGMRSVVLRARLLGFRDDDLLDAVQSGAVGLIRAVDRFDPDRGARLATFAWHWIGASMRRSHRPEVPLGDTDAPAAAPRRLDDDLLTGLAAMPADVLRLRFGIGPGEAPPMSRASTGQALGLTTAQVRTIEAQAMRQLRARLAKVVDRAPHA